MKLFALLLITVLSVFTALPQASDASHFLPETTGKYCAANSESGTATAQNKKSEQDTGNNSPMIALTFDDGPSAVNTPRILDILEENSVAATFFIIGRCAADNPEIIKRASSIGCEIGNHTYDHKNLTSLSKSEIRNQLDLASGVIEDILSVTPRFMRVPACHYNRAVKETSDMPIILWSVDTRDWSYGYRKSGNTPANRQKVIDEVMKAKDGDIVIMHDIYALTADCCEVIVPELCKKGYRLVTVSELLDAKGIEPENGHIYFKASCCG